MREIRFRGKRIDNGEWVYGYIWIIPDANLHYILTGKIDIRDCSIEKYKVDPETVGQYTNLKDWKNKDIYQADKLFRLRDNTPDSSEYIGDVVWNQNEGRWDVDKITRNIGYIPTRCIIHGTIHDAQKESTR